LSFSDITNRKKTELVKAKEKAEQSDRLNQRFWLNESMKLELYERYSWFSSLLSETRLG
jgi:hypothetical protein